MICLWCKKEFTDYASNHRKYCSRKCYENSKSVNMQGDKHWNWKGGITPKTNQRVNSRKWRTLREWIFNRDKEICQICKRKCNRINYDSGKIQCDHIEPKEVGGSDNPNNLQTLCLKCHMEKTKKDIGYQYPTKFCESCGKEISKKRGKEYWKTARYCSRGCFQFYMKTPEGKEKYSKIAQNNQFWKQQTNL